MFSDPGEERTIAPTARRLADARRSGRFAHSRELTSASAGCAAVLTLWVLGPELGDSARNLFVAAWSRPPASVDDVLAVPNATPTLLGIIGMLGAILGIPAVVAVTVNLLQQGFRLRFRGLPMRVWPRTSFTGGRRLPERLSPVNVGPTLVKLTVIAVLAGRSALQTQQGLSEMSERSPTAIAGLLSKSLVECSACLTLVLLLIAVADWIRSQRRFRTILRMTARELRDEVRDGNRRTPPRTNRARTVSNLPSPSNASGVRRDISVADSAAGG